MILSTDKMSWTRKFYTFLASALIAMLSVFFVANQANADTTGSIQVCKVIVDPNNNIVTGSDRPGQSFSISFFNPNPVTSQGPAAGVPQTTTFTTPLSLNSHILADQGNDSQCYTYSNLAFGSYYWAQESNPNNGWDTPFYSDQYTGPANSIVNLYSYDNNLFDGNQANDDSRNLNADGNIILTPDRPNRILIIANRYQNDDNQPTLTPTPTGTSDNGGNSGGGPVTFTCNDTVPSSAPVLNSVVINQNNATLSWTKAGDPVTGYYIEYGTQPGNYTYASGNIGNVTTYTVQNLSGGITYYFIVYAVNGCKSGPFSNEQYGTPSGSQVASAATGFAPIVLGAVAPTVTPSISPKVESISSRVGAVAACAKCFWWPILLGEFLVLTLVYFLFRKRKMAPLARLIPGLAIGLLAYIVFVLVNGGKCPFGVMDFHFFTIPCAYFWAVDGVLFLAIAFIFYPRTSRKNS